MARDATFKIPPPPDSPTIEELARWANDLYTFLLNNWVSGLQAPFMTQDQIDQMTPEMLTQAGRFMFNSTTGKGMLGEVSGGSLTMKTITTS